MTFSNPRNLSGVSLSGRMLNRRNSTQLLWCPGDSAIQFVSRWQHSNQVLVQAYPTVASWPPGLQAAPAADILAENTLLASLS